MKTVNVVVALWDLVDRCGSKKAAARQLGICTSTLYNVLNGKHLPGPSMYEPLGFEKIGRGNFRKVNL